MDVAFIILPWNNFINRQKPNINDVTGPILNISLSSEFCFPWDLNVVIPGALLPPIHRAVGFDEFSVAANKR